jgi:hypothetical protein
MVPELYRFRTRAWRSVRKTQRVWHRVYGVQAASARIAAGSAPWSDAGAVGHAGGGAAESERVRSVASRSDVEVEAAAHSSSGTHCAVPEEDAEVTNDE